MSPTELANIIDGELRPSRTGRTTEVIDPATETVLAHAPDSTQEDVDDAYRAAARAADGWASTTPRERQELLLELGSRLRSRSDELLDAEVGDTGKIRRDVRDMELPDILDQLTFLAGAARSLDSVAAGEYLADHTCMVRREPVGVVGQVTPWNYPLMMAVWKIAPALAVGNTIVLKPAETTPSSTLLLASIAADLLPHGVLNVVTGGRDTGRALVSHPTPAMVAITGSVRAGAEVARSAAEGVKRVHLELGGKAPAIVHQDADLDAAVVGISEGAFFNAGQDCTAATRLLVHRSVYDDFIDRFTDHVHRKVTTGAPTSDASYGALNNMAHYQRVLGHLTDLPGHIKVRTGGAAEPGPGYFLPPTVLTGARQDDAVVQEEIFGPVVTVQPFDDDDEALRMANGVPYGLAASVWTSDHGRALRAARALQFGAVWVNTHMKVIAEMPHGGFGQSGYGKDLSRFGIEDYTRIKYVMSDISR